MTADALQTLRERERAAFTAWRATPAGDLERNRRASEWLATVRALTDEMTRRACLLTRRS